MNQSERYLRFPLARRIEHWVMVASFTILALTGLPQKFITWAVSETMIALLGGIEFVRIIHRVSAVVLMLITVYHLGAGIYQWIVVRKPLSMLPSLDDIKIAWSTLRYNLKKISDKPKQGFYTFEEKFEYWALVWGMLIMMVTGFFLWNPITAAKFLPGAWIPAAKAAHGNEALLAVLAILMWHFYHVLIKHFNKSMYTGYMSREEMEAYHPLVLEEIPLPPIPNALFRQRRRTFTIGYGLASLVFLAGIYWFVTSEQTATTPPEEIPDLRGIEVFSPIDPTPYPTAFSLQFPLVDIGSTWNNGVGELFINRCGACHNPVNNQGSLDLTIYAGLLSGGNSGPAVIPGASGVSLVVIWQTKSDHPAQFSQGEIAALREWIDNQAPEN